jgi:hypothetical protein
MKTVEQLVDENPDATPEQITELMTQQPYSEVMTPSAPKPTEQAVTPAEVEVESAPAPTAPKSVSELYGQRIKKEDALEQDIEREEDAIRETKGSVGTEAALAAGGKVLAGTLGKMLNYDASPQVKGFEDAEKSIAGRTSENEQRRAFLKERLNLAANPMKRKLDELKLQGADRNERIGGATESDIIAQEKINTGLKSSDLTIKSNAAELSNKRVNPTSDLSQAARARESTKLKRTAIQIGKTDPKTAKSLMDMANNIETNQNLSEQELGLLEDMKFTPPEDQSLEWFKARTARENALRTRVGEEKAKMLSDKQVQSITDFDNAIEAARIIAQEKGDIDTGPISSAQNWLAQKIGIDDPEKTTFRARVGDQLAAYIKSISGATVSAAERSALLQNIPKMDDSDATFNSKLDKLRFDLERIREKTIQNIDRQGKNVSEFQQGSSNNSTSSVITDPNDL